MKTLNTYILKIFLTAIVKINITLFGIIFIININKARTGASLLSNILYIFSYAVKSINMLVFFTTSYAIASVIIFLNSNNYIIIFKNAKVSLFEFFKITKNAIIVFSLIYIFIFQPLTNYISSFYLKHKMISFSKSDKKINLIKKYKNKNYIINANFNPKSNTDKRTAINNCLIFEMEDKHFQKLYIIKNAEIKKKKLTANHYTLIHKDNTREDKDNLIIKFNEKTNTDNIIIENEKIKSYSIYQILSLFQGKGNLRYQIMNLKIELLKIIQTCAMYFVSLAVSILVFISNERRTNILKRITIFISSIILIYTITSKINTMAYVLDKNHFSITILPIVSILSLLTLLIYNKN